MRVMVFEGFKNVRHIVVTSLKMCHFDARGRGEKERDKKRGRKRKRRKKGKRNNLDAGSIFPSSLEVCKKLRCFSNYSGEIRGKAGEKEKERTV